MGLLKIYIIEDDIKRTEKMESFFAKLNGKLVKGLPNNDAGEFLLSNGIDNIETIVIRTESNKTDKKYYDYSYEDGQLEAELNKILSKDEQRIFIIDLALNEAEREDFSRNCEFFTPETAIKIIECIGSHKNREKIILNTRLSDMRNKWESVVDIRQKVKKNLQVSTIKYSVFADTEQDHEQDIQTYDALKRVWKA